eukprot:1567727-Prymnesium_polylepis.1
MFVRHPVKVAPSCPLALRRPPVPRAVGRMPPTFATRNLRCTLILGCALALVQTSFYLYRTDRQGRTTRDHGN